MSTPSRHHVWKMFDEISATYDRINRWMSWGQDLRWRRKVASFLPCKKALALLDVATGTGDQLLAILKKGQVLEKAVGIDLSEEMLKISREKVKKEAPNSNIQFLKGDAQNLPFGKETFDAVTLSFGIRNVVDPLLALAEIHRVLKPKGRCLILEFSLPPEPIRSVYLFYLRNCVPWIGKMLSKQAFAYRYLNETIETFPYGKAFTLWMKQARFSGIQVVSMALGAVSLYVGTKE